MGGQCCKSKKRDVSVSSVYFQQEKIKNYSLGKTIGKGSMSEVKVAYNKKTQQKYAIKMIDKTKLIKTNSYCNILNEKKILSKLNSKTQKQFPFIIKLIQSFQDRQRLYFVLEYAKYGNLRNFLNNKIKVDMSKLKFLTICLLIGLQFLHEKNIIHGDLKPQNILIDQKGYFKLCDFSSSLEYGCSSNNIKGTKGYMAPQIQQAENGDHIKLTTNKSDLYSLGVILWQMLNGKKYKRSRQYQSTQKLNQFIQLTQQSDEDTDDINQLLNMNSFIQSLLKQNIGERISIQNVWQHSWLINQRDNIEKYINQQVQNPYQPFDINFQYLEFQKVLTAKKTSQTCDQLFSSVLLNQKKVQDIFLTFDSAQCNLAQ